MADPVYIYVHGFNSSPASWKAQLFKRALEERGIGERFRCPKLSHWPEQAIAQLNAELERAAAEPVVLIGSSLGGYYSSYLMEQAAQRDSLRAVLINPAVRPYELLSEWLGENTNLYTDEHYQLTERHLQQLLALDTPEPKAPERYLLLVQTADETLDYRQAVDKYRAAAQFVQPGGSHGFDRFEQLIPAIFAFAEGRIALPEPTPLPASAL
ncbi:YqiA/YcfP family alpha/beta fold hydrolase [Marinobacterium sp. YM272]|uniref:YqiA/YcfP family alpha/beta fold hydrolase n=1 Tax=Marinobacterium sp. YM272 TaxID=3421654 RepID=UPI003D7F96DC